MNKPLLIGIALLTAASSLSAQNQAGENYFESVLRDHAKKSFVVIRQDYQLVNEEAGEIKNAPGKDYWKRTYSLGVRVGNENYLISADAVKPWRNESLSKNDQFQPAISYTAVKPVYAIEFDELIFDDSDFSEIAADRLYIMLGSEEPGLTVMSPEGKLSGYAIMAVPDTPLSDDNETSQFTISVTPMAFSFSESKKLYTPAVELPANAMGGVFVVPVSFRPGLLEFCITGAFQKIGGLWKLVSPESGTDVHPNATDYEYSFPPNFETMISTGVDDLVIDLNNFFGL